MSKIVATGKTIEEAVERGLNQLEFKRTGSRSTYLNSRQEDSLD